MTYSISISGHAESEAEEKQIVAAGKDFIELASTHGEVFSATASMQHSGQVDLKTAE